MQRHIHMHKKHTCTHAGDVKKNGYYTLNQTRKKRLNPKQKPHHQPICAELKKPTPRKEKIANKDSRGISADEL